MKFQKTVLQFSTGKNDYVVEIPDSKTVRKKFTSLKEGQQENSSEDSQPLEILKERLAKGEITEEEFKSKKEILEE